MQSTQELLEGELRQEGSSQGGPKVYFSPSYCSDKWQAADWGWQGTASGFHQLRLLQCDPALAVLLCSPAGPRAELRRGAAYRSLCSALCSDLAVFHSPALWPGPMPGRVPRYRSHRLPLPPCHPHTSAWDGDTRPLGGFSQYVLTSAFSEPKHLQGEAPCPGQQNKPAVAASSH